MYKAYGNVHVFINVCTCTLYIYACQVENCAQNKLVYMFKCVCVCIYIYIFMVRCMYVYMYKACGNKL